MNTDDFRCYFVTKDSSGAIQASLQRRPRTELPPGDVTIRVLWSSLNYKDGLAATGHPGVVRKFPHVPGIDAAGVVETSTVPDFQVGDEVLVTSYELGAGCWGAWGDLIRVPAEWVIPRPPELSPQETMILGTAGFTAAQSVLALQQHNIRPDAGEIVVTGATGGVGILAVMLLSKLGYHVAAVSGKAAARQFLLDLGAIRVLTREEVVDTSKKPLLNARWAGAVDTVGGETLSTILRQTQHGGCVTACGLVGGVDLALTVYPFILRGITLSGIDSALCSRERRLEIWRHLATDWRLDNLSSISQTTNLDGVSQFVQNILRGEIIGRTLVQVAD